MNKSFALKPVISEKSYKLAQEEGIYTFLVEGGLNKIELKKAIEKQFDVTVEKVRTIKIIGKRTRFGYKGKTGRRTDKRKVMAKLKEGDKIAVFDA